MVHVRCSFLFLCVIFGLSLNFNHAIRFGGDEVPADGTLERDLREEAHDVKRVKAIMLPSERPELKIGEIIEFELFDDNIITATVNAYDYRGMDSATWIGNILNKSDETISMGFFSLSCEEKACVGKIVVYSPVAEYSIGPLMNSVVSSDGDGIYQLSELDLTKKKISGTNMGMMTSLINNSAVLNMDKPQSIFWGHHSSDSSSVNSTHVRQLLDRNIVRGRSHIGTEDLPPDVDIPNLIVDCLFYYTSGALAKVGGRLGAYRN